MPRIRVLIADDHEVVREGLARVIAHEPDLQVAALAGDGEEALRQAIEHAPHVAIMDMRMPRLGGVAALKCMRATCPATRILVLSMYEDAPYQKAARAAGAHGYLSKHASAATLVRTIRALHQGGLCFGSSEHVADKASDDDGATSLSAREREIARLIARGHTQRAAAASLGISKSSVETYRARIFRKLGVESRVELLARIGLEDDAEP